MAVRLERNRLDSTSEIKRYRTHAAGQGHGAVATFTGMMRDLDERTDERILAMVLEHYPRMTETHLRRIVEEAAKRWQIGDPLVIHRIGRMRKGDDIVVVAVSARHRKDAFEACEFIVDYLKTRAPFWKKEITASGERWVEQTEQDAAALDRWAKQV